MSVAMSRRDLFERFIGRLRHARVISDTDGALKVNVLAPQRSGGRGIVELRTSSPRPSPPASLGREGEQQAEKAERVAVIQGRFCIALTSFCTVCVERCPEPGALIKSQGLPQVVADCCTGCGICQEVCPAPRNAVLMIPKKKVPATVGDEVTSLHSIPAKAK